jgi:type IV secretory pathway component VirB8
MKKIILPFPLLLAVLVACNSHDEAPKSENDVDAVRNFVQASLYGDYEKARKYMLSDSINQEQMSVIERVNLSPDEKRGLASASINIHNVNRVNDSTTVVIYSNSFKNNWDTLKAIRKKGEWLVDFKYLFTHDMDSIQPGPTSKTDSAK